MAPCLSRYRSLQYRTVENKISAKLPAGPTMLLIAKVSELGYFKGS